MPHKSRVNLYLPSMRPVKEKMPLSMMVVYWCVAQLLVGAFAAYQHYSFTEIAQQRDESDRILAVSRTELETLQARHADFKPSPQLLTKLERLTNELNGKRFLSQHLKGNVAPQTHDYSQVMLDMARYHDERIWLTKMRFDQQGVFLKGFASDALAVPEWLNKLQRSEFFSGKSFALMNLKDDKQQLIAFEINTVAKSMMDEDEKLAAIKALAEQGAQ